MEIVSCDNSACPHWKDDHYSLLDGTAHCPLYEGQELLDGDCPEFTSSNNKYTAPQATPKSCKLCGGSPTEKRSGQNYCPYCESYF